MARYRGTDDGVTPYERHLTRRVLDGVTGAMPHSPVTLVPVALEHADAVQRLAADPRVTATTNLPEPYPVDGAASFIAFAEPRHAQGIEYTFAILAHPADVYGGATLVGMCGLVMPTDPTAPHAVADLGYWIGAPYWGHGYATAAVTLLTAFAFAETPLHLLDAFPLVENAASHRVLAKAGATYLGDVPNKYPKWPSERLLAHYRFVRPR